MSFFGTMNISASGITAQRLRMDIISQNLANVNTTRANDGGPYKRKTVLLQEQKQATPFAQQFESILSKPVEGNGVRVARVVTDETKGNVVYEPSHPDANDEGYVEMPNVNVVVEMVNMIAASRSYEANVTATNITKGMLAKTLEISK